MSKRWSTWPQQTANTSKEDVTTALGRRDGPLGNVGPGIVLEAKRIHVRNLRQDSAEALVGMTAFSVDDEGQPMGALWPAGHEALLRIVKENGNGKIADCDYFELAKCQGWP